MIFLCESCAWLEVRRHRRVARWLRLLRREVPCVSRNCPLAVVTPIFRLRVLVRVIGRFYRGSWRSSLHRKRSGQIIGTSEVVPSSLAQLVTNTFSISDHEFELSLAHGFLSIFARVMNSFLPNGPAHSPLPSAKA